MGRSGLIEGDCFDSDEEWRTYNLYRATVKRSIQSKKGQTFLKKVAKLMDEMPEKRLISGELINHEGECCTIGVVCKAEGIDVNQIDYEDAEQVGRAMGISQAMAAEIECENDDDFGSIRSSETPEQRWTRMRRWVNRNILEAEA